MTENATTFNGTVLDHIDDDDVREWARENIRDISAMGPADVAREEGVPADPDDDEAVETVAAAMAAGYEMWIDAIGDLED